MCAYLKSSAKAISAFMAHCRLVTPFTRDTSVCSAGRFLTRHIMDSTERTLSSLARPSYYYNIISWMKISVTHYIIITYLYTIITYYYFTGYYLLLLFLSLHCYYIIITHYHIFHYYVLLLNLLVHHYYTIITYYYIFHYYVLWLFLLLHFIT